MSWEAQAWVCEQDLKWNEKWILMGLANYTDQEFKCWPSISKLAFKLGVTKPTVITNINALVKRRLILVEHQTRPDGGKGSNLYRLHLVQEWLDNRGGVVKNFNQGSKKALPPLVKKLYPILSEEPLKNKPKEEERNTDVDDLVNAWNKEFGESLSKVIAVTPSRRAKITARFKEHPADEFWCNVFAKIGNSAFLNGDNERGWKCTFDFLIANADNCVKIAEGKYDNKRRNRWQGNLAVVPRKREKMSDPVAVGTLSIVKD